MVYFHQFASDPVSSSLESLGGPHSFLNRGMLHGDVWGCWPTSAFALPLSGNATLYSIAMCSYNGMKSNRWRYYMAFKWVHFRARSLHQQHWREDKGTLWQFCCLLGATGYCKHVLCFFTLTQEGEIRHREGFWPAFSRGENKSWDPSISSSFWKAAALFLSWFLPVFI